MLACAAWGGGEGLGFVTSVVRGGLWLLEAFLAEFFACQGFAVGLRWT